jgi:hypothetical protein
MAKMMIKTIMIASRMSPRAIGMVFSYILGYLWEAAIFLPDMQTIIAYFAPGVNIDLCRFR